MATKVSYTDKSGKSVSATFPSRSLAEAYARSVRNPKIEDVATHVEDVAVKVCPVGSLEAQSEASKAYYGQTKAGSLYSRSRNDSEERLSERMAEHFAEARAAGQPMAVAWADWDFSHK
jgi:hypothetical protein